MQQTYELLGIGITGFSCLALIFLLAIEVTALRRYKLKCFLLLVIGTSFSVISTLIGAGAYFMERELPAMLLALEFRSLFYVVAVIFGLCGTVLLFESYGELLAVRQQSKTRTDAPLVP
ncbi:hypothetical protein [Pinirhizobacter soli]|uniref:hypothetical protein n=1 Tax=Pinirhizobacter soli TaxID=2786953 RepID=UPI00202A2FE2|nr:hypothetical protein [Pinirhizobacter soli]